MLTADPEICDDVAAVFNSLTGSTPFGECRRLLVAPATMRKRFTELIRREGEHARAGRPCGIRAKMNQLQDLEIIRELYEASQAGVPIELNVRGLCCLRPGVPGLSENIRVFGVVGRFLEHSRIFRFENGGEPEYLLGSADWMKRNLDGRVETILSVSRRGRAAPDRRDPRGLRDGQRERLGLRRRWRVPAADARGGRGALRRPGDLDRDGPELGATLTQVCLIRARRPPEPS